MKISTARKTVSVFKTNVKVNSDAQHLVDRLAIIFPAHRINFDLEDCDKILRIEGTEVHCSKVIEQLNKENYDCSLLEVVDG